MHVLALKEEGNYIMHVHSVGFQIRHRLKLLNSAVSFTKG